MKAAVCTRAPVEVRHCVPYQAAAGTSRQKCLPVTHPEDEAEDAVVLDALGDAGRQPVPGRLLGVMLLRRQRCLQRRRIIRVLDAQPVRSLQ